MASAGDIAGEIEKALGGVDLTDAQLLEIGHDGVNVIVLRTKAGLDADLNPFAAYAPEYAKERVKAGLSTTPDLARTGHMLGAMVPEAGDGEVTLRWLNPAEERKATFHNEGTNTRNAASSVRPHSRGVFFDVKTGRRVGREEVARDKRRKVKRVGQRVENVREHTRVGGVPKREFFDIRNPREVAVIEQSIDAQIQGNVEKIR